MSLTKKQQQVYDYMKLHADEEGQVSVRAVEIAKGLKMYESAVSLILSILVDKELVEKRGEGKYKRELWVKM